VLTAAEPAARNEPKATFGSLKKIREKLVQQNNLPGTGRIAITTEGLQTAWKVYVDILKAKKKSLFCYHL
jgi:hypothetical protein